MNVSYLKYEEENAPLSGGSSAVAWVGVLGLNALNSSERTAQLQESPVILSEVQVSVWVPPKYPAACKETRYRHQKSVFHLGMGANAENTAAANWGH